MNFYFWILYISLRSNCCCSESCILKKRDYIGYYVFSIVGFLGQTFYQISITFYFSMSNLGYCQPIGLTTAKTVYLVLFLLGVILIISSTLLIVYNFIPRQIYQGDDSFNELEIL